MLSARCRCCFRCCLRVSLHKLYKSVTSHGVMTATAISEQPSTFSAKLRAHQALSLEGFSWGWRHQSSCKGSVGALFAGLVLGLGRACPLARRQPRRGSAGGQVLWSSIRIRPHQPRRRRRRTPPTRRHNRGLHLERRQPDVPSSSKLRDRHRAHGGQLHELVLVPAILHGAAQHVHHGLGLVERSS